MNFKNEQSITEQGSPTRINEDDVYTSKNCAFVLDGATGVANKNVTGGDDVAWYVKEFKKNLIPLVEQDLPLHDILKQALKQTNEAFAKFLEDDSLDIFPSACLTLVRIRGDKLEYFSLGDSQLLIKFKDGSVKLFLIGDVEKFDSKNIQKAVDIAKEKGIDVIDARPYVNEDIRAQRFWMNKEGGYYILSNDINAIDHGLYGEIPLEEVDSVLGCSDGFSEIYYNFKHYSCDEIFKQLRKGKKLKELSDELKRLQEDDCKCNKVPRFKVRDDTSAYYVELG